MKYQIKLDILLALAESKSLESHKDDIENELDIMPWSWYKNWLIKYGASDEEIDDCFTFEPPCFWREHLEYFEKRFNKK